MTLQEHYNLIKEGKGNKKQFLSEAKRNHKDAISNVNTFDQAVNILKNKQVINENTYYADLQPITQFQPTNRQPFEKAFSNFLAEQKKEDDEAVKADQKKTAKTVEETQDHNFDYKDPKNVNNQIGQEVLNGIYMEVQKDPNITQEKAMDNVMKNLSKDKLHYVKDGQFGIEGLGYSETKSEEVSGNYKASGYSDKLKAMVNESLAMDPRLGGVVTTGNPNSFASRSNDVINQMMNELEDKIDEMGKSYDYDDDMNISDEIDDMDYVPGLDDGEGPMEGSDAEEGLGDELAAGIEEEAIVADEEPAVKIPKKNKKMTLQKRMAEIDKLGTALALEAKMEAIDEEIQERQDQLSMLDENESMKALMDPKKMKEIQKEIKLLEKKRGQYEKMHAKASKDGSKKDA
jgi:hypothetical protein